MQNRSYENDFDLHENESAHRTHFQMKGFVLRLVLKQRRKRTQQWPIEVAVQEVHLKNIGCGPVFSSSDIRCKWRKSTIVMVILQKLCTFFRQKAPDSSHKT